MFDCILSTNNDFAKHSTLSIDTGRVVDVCRICIRPLIPGKIRLVEPLIHVPSITSKLFFFLLRNSLILMGSNDIVIVEEGRLVTVVALIEDCIDCVCISMNQLSQNGRSAYNFFRSQRLWKEICLSLSYTSNIPYHRP